MLLSDEDYFYARAEAELKMAKAARVPVAAQAHYTLAGHYLNRAYGGRSDHETSAGQLRTRFPSPSGRQ
jgi:hypothetical protein